MAVIKKKIKRVEPNNTYLPHKIRSHPFYFINLPLKAILFFIFYWIVLVPVLYFIFLTYLPGFAAAAIPYFLVMFAVFLLIMGLFVGEWRRKKHIERKDVFYIKYERPDSVENLDVKKSLTDIERQPEEDVILRKKSREMIFLSDKKQIENQRSILIEEIKETIYLRESKQQAERPTNLRIEETIRPVSQNVNSPLTPRELFFLDMYEYANKAMRDVTAEFIKKERQCYVVSGPVYRSYSSSESSSDTQVIESSSPEQYPTSNQHYVRGKFYLDDEEYPKGVRYTIREQNITTEQYPSYEHRTKESQSPTAPDHSSLLKVLEKFSTDKNKNGSPRGRFDVKEVENEKYHKGVRYTIKEQYITSEQHPIEQQPEDRQSVINKPVVDYDLNILKVLKGYSNDKDGNFGARGRIEVKKEREYFIANVVPQESCVTEAFLYVDETKSDKKPKRLVAEFRESS